MSFVSMPTQMQQPQYQQYPYATPVATMQTAYWPQAAPQPVYGFGQQWPSAVPLASMNMIGLPAATSSVLAYPTNQTAFTFAMPAASQELPPTLSIAGQTAMGWEATGAEEQSATGALDAEAKAPSKKAGEKRVPAKKNSFKKKRSSGGCC